MFVSEKHFRPGFGSVVPEVETVRTNSHLCCCNFPDREICPSAYLFDTLSGKMNL